MGCDGVRLSITQPLTNYWVYLTEFCRMLVDLPCSLDFDVSRCVKSRYQKPLEVGSF